LTFSHNLLRKSSYLAELLFQSLRQFTPDAKHHIDVQIQEILP
jgi:hypothetical protein